MFKEREKLSSAYLSCNEYESAWSHRFMFSHQTLVRYRFEQAREIAEEEKEACPVPPYLVCLASLASHPFPQGKGAGMLKEGGLCMATPPLDRVSEILPLRVSPLSVQAALLMDGKVLVFGSWISCFYFFSLFLVFLSISRLLDESWVSKSSDLRKNHLEEEAKFERLTI